MKLPQIAIAGLVAGVTLVGTAWGGVGLAPVDDHHPAPPDADTGGLASEIADDGVPAALPDAALSAGEAFVGAAKVSMYPRPDDYDGVWEQDYEACKTLADDEVRMNAGDHLAAAGSPWNENPDCIYMGGFGLGPMNPAVAFESDPGLWVRSVAIGDGTETLILTIIDAEGYLWDYKSKCERCGAKQLAEDLGTELSIAKEHFVIAATHSHASPDLIGGWGFVPDWYMNQVSDAIKQSIRDAVAAMRPARLEVGEQLAREENHERRDTYRAAEEQQVTWLRALDATDAQVIATVGAYAAHPTTAGTNGGVASADWVGLFEQRLEERFGGIGFHFMTGLGNMSAEGGTAMGTTLANLIPDVGAGLFLEDTHLRVAQQTWKQPTTNVPLDALGFPGLFDREFLLEPSALHTGENPDTAPCDSASAFTVELPATAVRIGDQFALTAAPGEVFSNLTNTIKEGSGAAVTMPLAQANDALGYMPQAFEMSPVGQQGLGFFFGGVLVVNYEDAYAVDHCVGDMVLETSLSMLKSIR